MLNLLSIEALLINSLLTKYFKTMTYITLQTVIAPTLIALIYPLSGNAQACTNSMLTETDTVLSAKKGQHSVYSSADKITNKIRKSGGRARTDVRVYVNRQLVNSNLDFSNGNYTSNYRTKTLNNVKGKNIMVQTDNKSVCHTFRDKLIIEGETRSLMKPAVVQRGKLIGPGRKSDSYTTHATCGNKVRVVFRRTGGSGTSSHVMANLKISEKTA